MKNPLKTLLVLLVVFPLLSATYTTPRKFVTLTSILSDPAYSASLRYNPKGCHYLNPMLLSLMNHTNQDIYIVVNTGDVFEPSDPSCQDLVVTHADTLFVKSNMNFEKPISGMCIEPHDRGGDGKISYKYKKAGDPKLKQLADFVSAKNYQSSAAQSAVWNLIENKSDFSIYSNNKDELLGLNRTLEKILNRKPKPEVEIAKSNQEYYAPPTYSNKYWGEFDFKYVRVSNLKLGLFNTRGIQVRELYNNPQHPSGNSKVPFAFDMATYTDSTYNLILIRDDQIISKTVLKPYM